MTKLTRRQALTLGGLTLAATGLSAAGCAPVEPKPTPTTPTPTRVGPADWESLAAAVTLSRPGDSNYDVVRLTENPRYDGARPLGVLTAKSAGDVATGLAFASTHGVPIALRSGGHSYPGYSAGGAAGTGVNPSLVIDTRGMTEVVLAADNTVRIGAGASLAEVYDAIGSKGRAIAAGSCATVGITGLTLGGGVGVLVRAYGLTCDALTEVEIVTSDGSVHHASASSEPDLFWACRGGGGGHLGVVTALTFATQPAPHVTMFSLRWTFDSAAAVVKAWQNWAPGADPKLWSTLKLLNGAKYSEPGVFLSGTWLGDPSGFAVQLDPMITAAGPPDSNRSSQHSYLDAMMSYAGCSSIPVAECTTAPGGTLDRESFAATSHIANRPLDDAGVKSLIAQVIAAKAVPGIKEGGISMDALGGAVKKIASNATAFPHRSALATVQYTATFADGAAPAPLDDYVRGFRSALVPQWGEGAYVNYADAGLTDPSKSYFGANAPRLARIHAKYDGAGLFAQPQAW